MNSSGSERRRRRRERERERAVTNINIPSLDHDILCIIFSFLDLFDLVRCFVVCKSWNLIIQRSGLLCTLYLKQHDDTHLTSNLSSTPSPSSSPSPSPLPFNVLLEGLAMRCHSSALLHGTVHVHQWRGHTTSTPTPTPTGICQCRMKRGLILTGVGDKCMRLWSSENYNCLEEYSLPDVASLVDYDFDESKVVGLLGTRICIWRRHGTQTIFPAREGMFSKGLCMRYMDPEAVVGCEDGTVRVFDMYSRSCSQIIRMHNSAVTCVALGENQLIVSGSSLGSVTVSGLSSDRRVATLKSLDHTGIKTLCYNPSSQLVFAGSTTGHATCWDLRKLQSVWKTRVSPNVLYSMQYLQNDTSTLVVGGIDGVLRILDQNTGEVLSRCIMREGNASLTSARSLYGVVERKNVTRLAADAGIDDISSTARPPIKCLAVGMKKVVTTHNGSYIRVWKFDV